MQFMLDIITSLRTNNPQKIPGYDPDRIEGMRKLLRTHIKGSYMLFVSNNIPYTANHLRGKTFAVD